MKNNPFIVAQKFYPPSLRLRLRAAAATAKTQESHIAGCNLIMFHGFFPTSMTWWQFFADMLHLSSFFLLLLRLHSSRNTVGEYYYLFLIIFFVYFFLRCKSPPSFSLPHVAGLFLHPACHAERCNVSIHGSLAVLFAHILSLSRSRSHSFFPFFLFFSLKFFFSPTLQKTHRHFSQNARTLSSCLLHTLLGYLFQHKVCLPGHHEDSVHRTDRLHRLFISYEKSMEIII